MPPFPFGNRLPHRAETHTTGVPELWSASARRSFPFRERKESSIRCQLPKIQSGVEPPHSKGARKSGVGWDRSRRARLAFELCWSVERISGGRAGAEVGEAPRRHEDARIKAADCAVVAADRLVE